MATLIVPRIVARLSLVMLLTMAMGITLVTVTGTLLPRGPQVAFIEYRRGYAISLTDVYRALTVPLTPGGVVSREVWIAWSPDGRWLAYTPVDDNGNSRPEIVLHDASGAARVLPIVGLRSGEFDWSPDGCCIVYTALHEGSQGALFVLDVHTGDVRPIDGAINAVQPRWSPDGRWISYRLSGGSPTVMIADTETGAVRRLLTSDDTAALTVEDAGSWSPVGPYLAMLTRRSEGVALLIVRVPDGAVVDEILLAPGVSLTGAQWSPDGTTLAYSLWIRQLGRSQVTVIHSVEDGELGRIVGTILGWTDDGLLLGEPYGEDPRWRLAADPGDGGLLVDFATLSVSMPRLRP